MKCLSLIGAALALAVMCAFPASAAVVPTYIDQVTIAPTDHCISTVEGSLVTKYVIQTNTCDAALADVTGLCLMPLDEHAPLPKRIVLLVPIEVDTSCSNGRPSPPG